MGLSANCGVSSLRWGCPFFHFASQFELLTLSRLTVAKWNVNIPYVFSRECSQLDYRRLGSAGLKLSELSLGAWVTYGGQVGEEVAVKCMSRAYDAGVNFFDNAEAY